jgi:adenine/guanine phosphoribosyltransferase-like PRPP-binding protein
VTKPSERQSDNENVPISGERFEVSWHLKRDEAMRYMSHHDYKGKDFFDVLSLHKNAGLNNQMAKQFEVKIERYVEKNNIDWQDLVIVTPEVRGIPIAAQVAKGLGLPLIIIRKKQGYKLPEDLVQIESFKKGYGDSDAVELPREVIENDLINKKIILIDDGIASGESASACIRLLEKQICATKKPAEVIMILAILQHDYVNTTPKLSEHRLVKTLFDCHSTPVPVEVKQEVLHMKCA